MGETVIRIVLEGTDAALAMLKRNESIVLDGIEKGMRDATLTILARVKVRLYAGPHPMQRRGAAGLAGSITSDVKREGKFIRGIVGSTMPYKTGYAAILEKGGPIPEIVPRKGKALMFPNTQGVSGGSYRAVLASGGTIRAAVNAAQKTSRKTGQSEWIFVKRVRARYQQAYPYLRPSFDAERDRVGPMIRTRIIEALRAKGKI
ncbi:MAG TPA: hypothetical protein VEW47_11755 [Candidatus Dormibacteraeota bacterium]|nr:hypothetical protein [Candidatus Dormibacteraeota bacterium]